MIERPILFNGEMIRAILDGRKTVTRRAMKPQPSPEFIARGVHAVVPQYPYQDGVRWFMLDGLSELVRCPYGQPGDRLWVREAWAEIHVAQAPGEKWVVYREGDNRTDYGGPWKPSIHMPRRASRILLEITGVRVERLQAITRSDIRAEGLQCPPELAGDDVSPNYRDWYPAAFKELWNSTGGDWDANPWVWVVEFKRIDP